MKAKPPYLLTVTALLLPVVGLVAAIFYLSVPTEFLVGAVLACLVAAIYCNDCQSHYSPTAEFIKLYAFTLGLSLFAGICNQIDASGLWGTVMACIIGFLLMASFLSVFAAAQRFHKIK